MRKKGFTLIELLAVIVILAIIALIATPIIMNTIEKSKKGAAERSAENYMDAVEVAVGTERVDGNILDGEYTIQSDGNLCEGTNVTNCEEPIKIDMSGDKPSSGTIFIDNGIVTTSSTMTIKDYTVSYDETKKSYVANKTEQDSEEENNTPVTVYRWSTDPISIGDTINLSDEQFTADPTTLGKDYYLKHVVENNIVKESYACAKFNGVDQEICVRGGKDENGNTYYNENKVILQSLQDKGLSCGLSDFDSSCRDGSVALLAHSNGFVSAGGGDGDCYVDTFGFSFCERY